jgi:hypothetical protein
MKKKIIIILAVSLANFIYSQKSYVQGYFVKNNGEKTECLIDNKDWESSPKELYYKLTDNSKLIKINIDSITLFDLPGYEKYICREVKIDRSSENITNLSSVKNPVWQTEKLALKVLTEGKASLYMYRNHEITRFFYTANDSAITQLVHKSYQATNANGTMFVGINNNFRQQLFVEVNNPTYKYDLLKLNYEEKELKTYFEQYNAQFVTTSSTSIKQKVKRDSFKATVIAGLNVVNLNDASHGMKFGPIISPIFGAEFEFILPFFNNKWSFLVQSIYNSKINANLQKESNPLGQQLDRKFSYQGIDIPLGVRYRYSVNNKLKINATAYLTNAMLSWSNISIRVNNTNYDISTVSSQIFGIGIGVDYNNLGVELKYTGGQNFLEQYTVWYSEFNIISLGFKYRLIDLKINR